MGNDYQLQWQGPALSAEQMFALHRDIEARLVELNAALSTWQSDSELSHFNRGPAHQPKALDGHLGTVVTEALRLGRLSDGALDVTVGPLVALWGFGAEGEVRQVPSATEVRDTLAYTGLDQLALTDAGLVKRDARTRVDLSAIAKGYGVDQVAAVLEAHGIRDYLVDIGGELRVRGERQADQPWRVGVDKPYAYSQGQVTIVRPGDNALATSGDYRNYFEQLGTRYSHIVDPATGMAVQQRVISATVIAPSCMTADGLATAFMVMGVKASLALAEKEKIPLMLLEDNFGRVKIHYSSAFHRYIE
ncbi:FAD:protein FMN transferase [Ferrimonas balearica]|uniref:FAD:protein FMN transferase n=1 Tax=Ferrimonas balearica TaxID=44012 RepID=UPI001C995ECF|nr:FAD:protein FMN transferase [Ferrimonas balearica]MBY5990884.1 FAD:protein FMN transferase [Ferrimonas balearica]